MPLLIIRQPIRIHPKVPRLVMAVISPIPLLRLRAPRIIDDLNLGEPHSASDTKMAEPGATGWVPLAELLVSLAEPGSPTLFKQAFRGMHRTINNGGKGIE